jgi:hypothetical protein
MALAWLTPRLDSSPQSVEVRHYYGHDEHSVLPFAAAVQWAERIMRKIDNVFGKDVA